MRRLTLLSLAALAASACASGTRQGPFGLPGASPSSSAPDATATMDQALTRESDGAQPGKIQKLDQGMLFLTPYQSTTGLAELQLDPHTPVYQNGQRVGLGALQLDPHTPVYQNGQRVGLGALPLAPGKDVRVYFQLAPAGQQPRAVAIELLSAEEAQRAQRELK